MIERRRLDGSALFAAAATALATVALIVVLVVGLRGSSGRVASSSEPGTSGVAGSPAIEGDVVDLDDGAVADPNADVTAIMASSAAAMATVTSVEFELDRSGAPIYIDQFEAIALDHLRGQFTVPTKAQAELTVTVNGNLVTKLGAVAIDQEVWISNPVTGDFETLPDGYDIYPSKFFDPKGGWQPLLANLFDVELVGIDDRGGDRYHIRGTAPAAEVRNITVGLVRGQDVPVELWIHPGSNLVTAAEFATEIDGQEAIWKLGLRRYGEAFTIAPPANVRN